MEWDFSVACEQSLEFNKTLTKRVVDSCHTAILKIKVRNAEEQPLAGAKVVITGSGKTYEGYSGEDGYVVTENLSAPVNYLVTISKDGFETLKFELKLEHCDTYTKAVILH